ncbi:hypothetical protein F66182_17465, partial [Fusarium sp. NRRL 66182]
VEDLKRHFVERWNYIYDTKYRDRNQQKYQRLDLYRRPGGSQLQGNPNPTSQTPQPPPQAASQPVPPNQGQLNSEPHWQQAHAQLPTQQPGQSYYPPPAGQEQQYPGQQYHTPPPTQQYYPPTSPNQGQQLPPPPNTQQQQPQWQGQSQTGSQSYYPPPPPSQEHQQQSSYSGYTSTGSTQSTAQYYPPPPPGPTPSQIGNSNPGQYQNTPSHSSYDSAQYSSHSPNPAQTPYFPPPPGQEPQQSQTQTQTRGLYEEDGARGIGGGSGRSTTENVLSDVRGFGQSLRGQLAGQVHQYQDRYITNLGRTYGNQSCQV